jgi:hypothetical protein
MVLTIYSIKGSILCVCIYRQSSKDPIKAPMHKRPFGMSGVRKTCPYNRNTTRALRPQNQPYLSCPSEMQMHGHTSPSDPQSSSDLLSARPNKCMGIRSGVPMWQVSVRANMKDREKRPQCQLVAWVWTFEIFSPLGIFICPKSNYSKFDQVYTKE